MQTCQSALQKPNGNAVGGVAPCLAKVLFVEAQ